MVLGVNEMAGASMGPFLKEGIDQDLSVGRVAEADESAFLVIAVQKVAKVVIHLLPLTEVHPDRERHGESRGCPVAQLAN